MEGEKGLDGTPLTRMENRVDKVRLKIQETQEGVVGKNTLRTSNLGSDLHAYFDRK